MVRKMQIGSFPIFCLILVYGSGILVSAQTSFISGATLYEQAARSGLNGADELCLSIVCTPELLNQLAVLRVNVDTLRAALNPPPNLDQIRFSIQTISTQLPLACTQLGVQCPDPPPLPPAGMDDDIPVGNPNSDLAIVDRCSGCESSYTLCQQEAANARQTCINGFNRWLNCRMRTPYCFWRGSPFDDAAFHFDCQDLITAGDILDCRCTCPQAERQGGCPQFFQSPPPGSFDICRPNCSFQACARGDTRCSCTGQNQFTCDLCQYEKATLIAVDWKRAVLCEKLYTERLDRCDARYVQCVTICPPP